MSSEFLLIFWAVLFLISVFFAWYFLRRPKENERNLLIEKAFEKDLDIQKLMDLPAFQSNSWNFRFPWLKIGTVVVCGSFGIVLGMLIEEFSSDSTPELIGPVFFLFGGIGLVLAHFLGKKYNA